MMATVMSKDDMASPTSHVHDSAFSATAQSDGVDGRHTWPSCPNKACGEVVLVESARPAEGSRKAIRATEAKIDCLADVGMDMLGEPAGEIARAAKSYQHIVGPRTHDELPPTLGNFDAASDSLDSLPNVGHSVSQDSLPTFHAMGLNTVNSLPSWSEVQLADPALELESDGD